MKHFLFNMKISMTAALIALPLLAIGQNQNGPFVDRDNLFIYTTSSNPGVRPSQVDKVYLSEVADEILIKKNPEVTKEKIEATVLNLIPSGQINWEKDDVCFVSDNQPIVSYVSELLANDDIVSAAPAYIRRVYKDLIEQYPVSQVAIYGFTDVVYLQQKYTNDNEVDALLSSLGYRSEVLYPGDEYGGSRTHNVYVPKDADVISVANTLYESGYFYFSSPTIIRTVKNMNTVLPDKSGLDFVYGSGGDKTYYYKVPGQFMITKDEGTDKSVIEEVIGKYLASAYFDWKSDNRCQIETKEELVDEAINNIRNEPAVVSANRSYLMQSDYENALLYGQGYPNVFNLDQYILINLKDGIAETVRNSLSESYGLTFIEESPIYTKWLAPKTADVIEISNAIYESGYVNWVELNWITGLTVQVNYGSGGTTDVKKPVLSKVNESYYDMLGRRMDSPSGLTIVVTRYSDGSVRTEKKLVR